jgi:hypothetical protein
MIGNRSFIFVALAMINKDNINWLIMGFKLILMSLFS